VNIVTIAIAPMFSKGALVNIEMKLYIVYCIYDYPDHYIVECDKWERILWMFNSTRNNYDGSCIYQKQKPTKRDIERMGVFLFFIRECEKDDDVDAKYEKFVKALAGVNWIQKHPVIQFSNQILRGNKNALREVLFLKKKPTTFFLLFDDPPSSSYFWP